MNRMAVHQRASIHIRLTIHMLFLSFVFGTSKQLNMTQMQRKIADSLYSSNTSQILVIPFVG